MSTEPERTEQVPLELIDPPARVLRRSFDEGALVELEQSMAANGQIQPIAARRYETGERRQIIVGHRRFLVAVRLGWRSLRAEVYPPDTKTLDVSIAENEHRAELSPMEQASLVEEMLAGGDSVARVAARWKRSEAWVDGRRSLLACPEDVQDAVERERMPLSVARLLAQIDHPSYRARLIDDWKRHGASAATVAVWLQAFNADRFRIAANENTVDELIARRDVYRVVMRCEYCQGEEALEKTRVWRLCGACTTSLLDLVKLGRDGHPAPV